MVGRDRELKRGEAFLASLHDGPGTLVLEGDPGIGKTTVWRELVARGRQLGWSVLTSRPAAAEARLSFSGLSDLLGAVDRALFARLPEPQRLALEVALLEAAPGSQPLDRLAVFAGLRAVLHELAQTTPVLVAIDDAQWLDRPTQAAVEFALRRRDEDPVGLLCAVRWDPENELSPGLSALLTETSTERLRLPPLSVGSLHELIAERIGCSLSRPAVVRIASATRGNALHAVEVAREWARRGDPPPGELLPAPDDLLPLIGARLQRVSRAGREALLAAAALATPLVELVDPEGLASAERAGLVDVEHGRVRFTHPLYASAIYASASAAERRALHERLARLVAEPEQRARHLALAADEPDEMIALELERAAERARARGAPETAADLLELAAGLTPPGAPAAMRRTLEAAECHFHAGDRARARSLTETVVRDGTDRGLRSRGLALLGEIRYHEDSFRDALPLLEQALEGGTGGPRSVRLHLDLAFVHANLGDLAATSTHAEAAVGAAQDADDDGLLAAALAMAAMSEYRCGGPLQRQRLERALALERREAPLVMPMRPSRLAGIAHYLNDELDVALALYERMRDDAIERGEDSHLPMLDADISLVERSRGNLQRALSFAEEGCAIARMTGSRTTLLDMLGERSHVLATLGEIERARADAAEALALEPPDGEYPTFWLSAAIAFLELSLGNAQAASDALEPLCCSVEARGHFDALTAILLADKIEALIGIGQLGRAERLTELLGAHGEAQDRPSALAHADRCRGLIAAARGELTAARAHLIRARSTHGRTQMPLELGRTLLVQAQIERRMKQKRSARRAGEEALGLFIEVGAPVWAARARAELERCGPRHRGRDELTPTELRVAVEAANGLTNRQIAEAAFISPKTVEANLARVYVKLGIRSRAELGRAMGERERREGAPEAQPSSAR